MRPNRLRRILALTAAISTLLIVGGAWSVGVAKADEVDDYTALNAGAICLVLDDNPNTAGLLGVMEGVHDEGITSEDSGRVVAMAIETWCPRHWPLLLALVEVDDETVIV